MKISRREFFYATGTTVAVSALPEALRALAAPPALYPLMDLSYFDTPLTPGPMEIRVGYAAIAWGGNDTQAITEISAAGYPGIQLRANAVQEFPDPTALRGLLEQHNLKFAALSSGDVSLDPAQEKENLAMHEAHAKYLHAGGGTLLQVIGTFRSDGAFTPEDCQREARLLTEIGKRAADYGVKMGFHNHMGSIAQAPDRLDMILGDSDPRYVKLLLDTGHYKQGGGDSAAAIRKYRERLLFLHLKDVKPAATKSGYEFTPLGQGTVDFPAIMAALNEINFRGWAIVELDGPQMETPLPPEQAALLSKQYLERKLAVRV